MFQITLDGNKEQHNRIKKPRYGDPDSFAMTINNIHRIQETIQNSFVAVRINFDGETLNRFDEILEKLDDLDRKRTKIILKKSGKSIPNPYRQILSTGALTKYLIEILYWTITVREVYALPTAGIR